jgi:hypothetical protein
MHTADPNPFVVEITTAKLKSYKSPGSGQIKAEGETLRSEIHEILNCIWNKEELPDQWKESIIVPVHKKGHKLNVIIIVGYRCCQLQSISLSQG